jgi:hypothetical protein
VVVATDSIAALVGEHNAVVWNRVNLNPSAANASATGVWHGPPNALDAPKPTSSSRITNTLGAPAGGRNGSIGGYDVSGSLASNVTNPDRRRSGIGSTSRARSSTSSPPSHDDGTLRT